ncbi:MAG: methyltransferase domain-containing protein [Rhodobacteraceae bacterium]|nr:methyltransferase domain-containing protein [Paracoccaceae bacterium]
MNKIATEQDWKPDAYNRFQSARLRPALDLLAAVPALPNGDIVDLGCGGGSVGTTLKRRFSGYPIVGIDRDGEEIKKARYTGAYDTLKNESIVSWQPETPPALIFANSACQDIGDHETLFPHLVDLLAPGGVLAVQMPRQDSASSHALLRVTAEALFPDVFDFSDWVPPVDPPIAYHRLLSDMGRLSVWETHYLKHLPPGKMGHPVLEYTEETAMVPYLGALNDSQKVQFLVTYGESLKDAYPLEPDGSVLMPMQRLFFVLKKRK